jgi:hypothetical protein
MQARVCVCVCVCVSATPALAGPQHTANTRLHATARPRATRRSRCTPRSGTSTSSCGPRRRQRCVGGCGHARDAAMLAAHTPGALLPGHSAPPLLLPAAPACALLPPPHPRTTPTHPHTHAHTTGCAQLCAAVPGGLLRWLHLPSGDQGLHGTDRRPHRQRHRCVRRAWCDRRVVPLPARACARVACCPAPNCA